MKKILAFIPFLVSCSIITYEALPDGSTKASGYELGTNTALEGAKFTVDKSGSRSLEINSMSKNQVEGLKQINQGLSLIIEGAVNGAK